MTVLKKINNKKISTIAAAKEILFKLVSEYADKKEKRYVSMDIGGTCKKTIYVDLKLAFELEPLLYCTPGYSREHSVIQLEANSLKRMREKKFSL